MEQEQPTSPSGDASPLDRIEAFLSADDAPASQEQSAPPQNEAPKADVPTAQPQPGDQPEREGETPNEYQLSDLAKLLGADESALDVDEDGAILVKTKIDGQEGKAKFSDLVKSYQLQGHVDKQVREAAEIKKAAQEQAQVVQQQLQVQQAVIGKIAEAKAIEAEIGRFQQVDWNGLYDSDPAQAVKLDRQMRDLYARHQHVVGEINQASQFVTQQQQQQRTAMLQAEHQALLNAAPEWANADVANREKQAIAADLKARGFTDSDIQSLADHKAVILARDAMLYRQMQQAGSVTEKQVRAAPKIIKPGSAPSQNRAQITVQKLKSEVRQSGSKQSVMDYLLATGKV